MNYRTTNRTGTPQWKRIRDRRRTLAQQAGQTRCPDCNVLLDWEQSRMPNSAEVDHIIPHAQGGTDHLDNTRICCRKCNQSKGGKLGSKNRQQRTKGDLAYTAPRAADGRRPGWPPWAPDAYN